jgi:hypothetical protein
MDSSSQAASGHEATDAMETHAHRRRWLILGAFVGAAGVALGLLEVFGGEASPLLKLLTVLTLIGGFVLALVKTLGDELKQASRRSRVTYVISASVCALALVAAGLITTPPPTLTRLSGTSDVAIVGIRAANPEEQGDYDDLAASLPTALPKPADGEIRNYTPEVNPPLDELQLGIAAQQGLNRWLANFFRETDAELVLAGFTTNATGGQSYLHIATYVPALASADAPELSGWFPVTDYLVDRSLNSIQARKTLLRDVSAQFSGLASFLQGLDAWENGNAADAVNAFGTILQPRGTGMSDTLVDLALLFRGHAYETKAQVAGAADKRRLLELAMLDYQSVPTSSPIFVRARLSLATNDYLRAASSGCVDSAALKSELAHASATLADIEKNAHDEMVALKSRANRAQIEYCRYRAGDRTAKDRLPGLLAPLIGLSVTQDEIHANVKNQVKALALAIDALMLSDSDRLPEAIETLQQAISLERWRLERQALWLGLKSGWLLASCRIEEASQAQKDSLSALRIAVQRSRVPDTEVELYATAFASDMTSARERCNRRHSRPR